jgi:hypothetical protein
MRRDHDGFTYQTKNAAFQLTGTIAVHVGPSAFAVDIIGAAWLSSWTLAIIHTAHEPHPM